MNDILVWLWMVMAVLALLFALVLPLFRRIRRLESMVFGVANVTTLNVPVVQQKSGGRRPYIIRQATGTPPVGMRSGRPMYGQLPHEPTMAAQGGRAPLDDE